MINAEINGVKISLETNGDVFSPSAVDRGTLAMLSLANIAESDIVLDLGCGCGIVGIYAAKLVGGDNVEMCDISENAVGLSNANAELNGICGLRAVQSDGLSNITRRDFTVILSNPPYHTDFSVAKGFIENGYRHLAVGGRMLMVTKRLEWYKNKLTSVFGGVRVYERDGYFVFIAEKRAGKPKQTAVKNTMSKKLMRKQTRGKKRVGEI